MNLKEISSQRWEFIIDHTEKLPQGIHLWYKGVPYPRRVYYDKANDPNHFLLVLNALGTVKKFLFALTFLKGVAIPYRLSVKKYEPFLQHIFNLIQWNLAEFWIKDEEYSVPVWEIGKLLHRFLWELGLNMFLAADYARVVMMILEFDNAYRYRVQDLLGELHWLDRRTLKYILDLYEKRELMVGWGVKMKIKRIVNLLKGLLWFPKVKRALKKAHQGIDFRKIELDINDRYHTSFWRGYDYGGKNFDERYQFFLDTHKGEFPPFQKRKDPEETANFMVGK